MYNKILVPLDGSDLSECALKHAVAIAQGCRVPEVVLLGVAEPVHHVYELSEEWRKTTEGKIKTETESYLARVAAALGKEGMAATVALEAGQPAEAILGYAKKSGVDLIVMSSHGKSGVTRWVMGSVSDRVLSHSEVPVLVVLPEDR